MVSDSDGSTGTTATLEGEKPERGGRRAARAEKKLRRQERKRQGAGTLRMPAIISLLTTTPTSREEAEREAAMEFDQAVAPSMERLRAAVPDASSAEEAWRAIESRLGPPSTDPDPELPSHPVYTGDTLVYHQLRRHYGRPAPAGSFRLGWSPGEQGGLPPATGRRS